MFQIPTKHPCEIYLDRQRDIHKEKMKSFVRTREREYCQDKMHSNDDDKIVDINDAKSLKKWMWLDDNSNEGEEDENKKKKGYVFLFDSFLNKKVRKSFDDQEEREHAKRNSGLLKIFSDRVRESFDCLRWHNNNNNKKNDENNNDKLPEEKNSEKACNDDDDTVKIIEETFEKHLNFLLISLDEIFGSDDANWVLKDCLAGSLLVKERGDDNNGAGLGDMKQDIGNDIITNIQPPHGASRLSRFNESAELIQSFGGGEFREARCIVRAHEIACNGLDVDGNILALSGSTGFKHRVPWFGVRNLDNNSNRTSSNYEYMNDLKTGFYDPGCNVSCSQQLRSVACMAEKRIKIFDVDTLSCKATLQAERECFGPIFFGDKLITVSSKNNQIYRWNVADLKPHEALTLEEIRAYEEDDEPIQNWLDLTEETWNEEIHDYPENIDVNVGEKPHATYSILGLSDNFEIGYFVKNNASSTNTVCIGSLEDASISIVDLNQSKICMKLLGHLNVRRNIQISTSNEVPNLLLSNRSDQHARLWDLRCGTTPVLTLVHGRIDSGLGSCCLAESMIGFTSGIDQCIRAWDLRVPACLYKLSCGNTNVIDMDYSAQKKTLFAISHGIDCRNKQYFPSNYFPYDWNAYTQRGLFNCQHRSACSHLLTYEFQEEGVDVNKHLPRNVERVDEYCDDDEYF